MKIAIEAQRIFRSNKHGMDFVALETIRELQKIDQENEYYILVSPGEDRCLHDSHNMHIIELKCPTYPLWEQVALPLAIHKIKPDILHCTSNTAPIYCKVPLVLTLHDIIFLEKRQNSSESWYQNMGWYYRKLVVPNILQFCKRIITVSNFERLRIQKTLQLTDSKIRTVYNGYGKHFTPIEHPETVTKKYINAEKYLFFLGNTDPKKNTSRTLIGYSLYIKQSLHPLPLLIADLKEEVIDTILKENRIEEIKPLLVYPGYIPNTDLPYIYNGAFAFIYTSLRESFGIPQLEAMACGTPVIASNTSAMPEIAGKDAILINPLNPKEIADKLIELETNTAFYQQQVAYGLTWVKNFSWQKTAIDTLSVYQSINK